ncbi:MAG: ribulose-phosphate 3-epimerase [Bacteroidota bacterium]
MAHLIAPSVLAADFSHLHRDIEMVNASEADWLHIDVMDGSFVPNISFGQVLMPALKKSSRKPLDVHLMIDSPERYIEQFAQLGADHITIHVEATNHVHRCLTLIRSLGCKAGVALNPHTPVQAVEEVLEEVDIVLLMSVNPGFGGQKFIYRTVNKVEMLKDICIVRNLTPHIEIDGGVGLHNAERLLQAGADTLVAGSAVFSSDDPIQTIHRLKSISSPY